MKACKHEPDFVKNICKRCGVKIIGIAKKDIEGGDKITIVELNDGSLFSKEINFLESINANNLKNL